jgi:8-oxo-dGTP diphosphatase
MKLTTLCYIENDKNEYLMLHRTKKENDQSHDKWLGVGGKFESDESPEECLLREVKEETGLTLTDYRFRGMVTFVSDNWATEYMHIFTASKWEGRLTECNEGELVWIPKTDVMDLKIWEGDRLFLKHLINDENFFSLKLKYDSDEKLKEHQEKVY